MPIGERSAIFKLKKCIYSESIKFSIYETVNVLNYPQQLMANFHRPYQKSTHLIDFGTYSFNMKISNQKEMFLSVLENPSIVQNT